MLNKYLDNAKELYVTADMNDSWQVSLGERVYSKSYDQAKLQGAIVSQHKAKERAERRVTTYKKMVSRADSLTEKIDAKQEQINEVLLDLSLTIELAKAAEQMTDLTGLSDRGKEIHVTVKALMEELDRAFVAKLAALVEDCTRDFENYDYARSLQQTESFFWSHFTDTYLELVKVRARRFADGEADTAEATAEPLARALGFIAAARAGASLHHRRGLVLGLRRGNRARQHPRGPLAECRRL